MPQADTDRRHWRKKFCSRRVLGKKRPNAFLVCFANAALGDQTGHQLSRRHVEAVVRGGTFIWRNSDRDLLPITPAVGVFYFFRATLFDRNFLQSVAQVFQSIEDEGSAT